MKLGIVGLPNVGKSTLFNAITNAGAASANYPFCTIDPNIGIVIVPDERLETLTRMYNSKRTTYTTIEFVDIAGLVKGASRGEGLGNKFLSHIREVDAIVHVVRCFNDGNITHVDGKVDPIRDINTVELELILSDIEIVDRKIEKIKKNLKSDKSLKGELDFFENLRAVLDSGKSAKTMEFSSEEKDFLKTAALLSLKPVIYAANLSEDDFKSGYLNNENYQRVDKLAKQEKTIVLPICAKLEEEIAQLGEEDKLIFLHELGIKKSGLDSLIWACYEMLGLISFLTAGEQEVRAWMIKKGMRAPQAAGKIHSDFERGFIRAEVAAYDDLVKLGSISATREKGLVRSEGKNYEVKDGDVILFRFNV